MEVLEHKEKSILESIRSDFFPAAGSGTTTYSVSRNLYLRGTLGCHRQQSIEIRFVGIDVATRTTYIHTQYSSQLDRGMPNVSVVTHFAFLTWESPSLSKRPKYAALCILITRSLVGSYGRHFPFLQTIGFGSGATVGDGVSDVSDVEGGGGVSEAAVPSPTAVASLLSGSFSGCGCGSR